MKEKKIKLYSKELNKDKIIRVYLPDDYSVDKKYRVLYFHDGQNIVRKSRWSKCSWEVDVAIKNLGISDLIVVGIDSDKDRDSEYCYLSVRFKNAEKVKIIEPKAKKYADFLVNYVKPYVDYHFSTDSRYESTYLAGSSFGATITSYISALHKNVFSYLGIFSIANTFLDKHSLEYLESIGIDKKAKYFLAVGTNEVEEKMIKKYGNYYLKDFDNYYNFLSKLGVKNIDTHIYEGDFHSEICWKNQLYDFLEPLK